MMNFEQFNKEGVKLQLWGFALLIIVVSTIIIFSQSKEVVDDKSTALNSIKEEKTVTEDVLKEHSIKKVELETKEIPKVEKEEVEVKTLTVESEPKQEEHTHNVTGADTITVHMTAYTAFCNTGCIGITRTGYDVSETVTYKGMRIIATDPDYIPLYSIVKVYPEHSQEPFKAISLDTGGAIDGNRIDFLVKTKDRAFTVGRQKNVKLEILRYGKGE